MEGVIVTKNNEDTNQDERPRIQRQGCTNFFHLYLPFLFFVYGSSFLLLTSQVDLMSPSFESPPRYDAHSDIQTTSTSLKPYLQLHHILSLTWLAYPVISLLFVIFRLQLSSDQAQSSVANAKDDLLTACQAAELAATAAASMPRYLAMATNQQFADAVNGTMNGAREALVLALTCMEAIINFLIDIYRSTFLCFLELVVVGGLDLLISAVQEVCSPPLPTPRLTRSPLDHLLFAKHFEQHCVRSPE